MQLPETVFASFAGVIDAQSIGRIFQNCAGATQGGAKTIHLLFQSTGGIISDGISLYNFFRSLPLEVHLYNTGGVHSIAVLAYLGAAHRHVSEHANFMIHKSHFGAQAGVNAAKLGSLAESLLAEDARTEAIVKQRTNIPADKWSLHALQEVTFNAQEAVQFGIADDIREFQVPSGHQLFNI
jgi:ATP-dependent protease ClpP protease subunit